MSAIPKSTTLQGGTLKGDHYYRVQVSTPISSELSPYAAECGDIITALGLTFNEGELFKAIWRLAKARQGLGKNSNTKYERDKIGHYARIVSTIEKSGEVK